MKKTLTVLFFLCTVYTGNLFAQESILGEVKYDDLDKYVALALKNYPRREMYEQRSQVFKEEISQVRASYFDIFNFDYYYRPQNKVTVDPTNPYVINGFQFGINFNLGDYLEKPYRARRARAEYKAALAESKEYEILLRLEVKKYYLEYIQALNLLKINNQMATDNKSVTETLRSRFEKGQVTLDTYNQARLIQYSSYQNRIQAEIVYLKAKETLEEFIGSKLVDVK
ncbi:TolC family protein [Pedobacter sp. MW01-1-1]|uniref:TolC family protein n=1 Tax=Pedobacter sp. MW01-1-1 TaxID=3383027 RepID=UPI003FED69F2